MPIARSKRLAATLIAVAGVLLAVALGPAAGAQESEEGRVTIVHGLRGLAVDIYVNGELFLPAFEPDRLTDAVPLPPGDYRVDLREAGSPSDSQPRFSGVVPVAAGDDIAVVAHFGTDGEWTATVFDNHLSPLDAGEARLVFRHTAHSPAIDVLVNDQVAVAALAPPNEITVEVPPASVAVGARLADGTAAATAPDVAAREGEATALYLVGDAATGNLTWLMQSVAGLQTAPSGVPAGNSGLADTSEASSLPWGTVAVVTAVLGPFVVLAWRLRAQRPGRDAEPCSAAY
jgi:hypothetical protein